MGIEVNHRTDPSSFIAMICKPLLATRSTGSSMNCPEQPNQLGFNNITTRSNRLIEREGASSIPITAIDIRPFRLFSETNV